MERSVISISETILPNQRFLRARCACRLMLLSVACCCVRCLSGWFGVVRLPARAPGSSWSGRHRRGSFVRCPALLYLEAQLACSVCFVSCVVLLVSSPALGVVLGLAAPASAHSSTRVLSCCVVARAEPAGWVSSGDAGPARCPVPQRRSAQVRSLGVFLLASSWSAAGLLLLAAL